MPTLPIQKIAKKLQKIGVWELMRPPSGKSWTRHWPVICRQFYIKTLKDPGGNILLISEKKNKTLKIKKISSRSDVCTGVLYPVKVVTDFTSYSVKLFTDFPFCSSI